MTGNEHRGVYLFAPGDSPHKLRRVTDFGADAVVLDLEDAVHEDAKDQAVLGVIEAVPHLRSRAHVVVRVNGIGSGRTQHEATMAADAGAHAIMLPKVDGADQLAELDDWLAGYPDVAVLPLIETARGLLNVDTIAATAPERVRQLVLGSGDLATDLALELTSGGQELLHARSRIVLASRAAGLEQPIDGPYLDLDDDEGLRADTVAARRLGFGGRLAIAPRQVRPITDAFTNLDSAVERRARRIVEQFEEALADGRGVITVDGRFVDAPIYHAEKARLQRIHRTTREATSL